jgi:outer membrane receptor protein involved in Fe transport
MSLSFITPPASRRRAFHALGAAALCAAFVSTPAAAQNGVDQATTSETATTVSESIQVVATRIPEAVEPVPAAITVVSGDELRARGADDLPSALALVAGLSIAPGGDGGPASSVPEIWGLREFDAFLLMVDGVPWGGAFNPALATLDLNNIARIEILRGPAPVMYGATSFVGVIHVLHYAAGEGQRSATAYGGNHSSGGASVYLPFAPNGAYTHSLAANYDSKGSSADRAGFDRGHLLYRGALAAAGGNFRFDFDATFLQQEPASPHVRQGRTLTTATPLDANHNPGDAKLDENRFHLVSGYERAIASGAWTTTLALTRTERDLTRGFLAEVDDAADPNAAGFSQDQSQTDVYFDTHFARRFSPEVNLIAGLDYLYGKGESEGENFDYHVHLDGSGAQASGDVPVQETTGLEDERGFGGLYAQVEWTPMPRLRFDVGGRFNFTDEKREGEVEGEDGEETDSSSRSVSRGSGTLGVSFQAWNGGDAGDGLWIFADYRDAFKPAAIDFGPEAEAIDILKPETATSTEGGLKGRMLGGRFEWQASAFRMDFENLVTSVVVDGRPALVNSGEERFEGYELEGSFRMSAALRVQASYAHHDSKFVDFVQLFDGVPTQLAGKRLEMAPQELGALGVSYFPERGLTAWATWNYVGDRYLNKRNTALAPAVDTYSAGLGWRLAAWRFSLVGENLTDERDPVAESELGDAQYYRQTARSYELRVSFDF